jgi:magnesium transporter
MRQRSQEDEIVLNLYPRQDVPTGSQDASDDWGVPKPIWWDLLDGTDEERATVQQSTGLQLPTKAQISEIESSSRLYIEGDALYLSAPVISRGESGTPVVSPIGFVLSPHYMVTVRFAALPSFETFTARINASVDGVTTSSELFVGLLEAIIDRLADVLEQIGVHLDEISDEVFHSGEGRPRRADRVLRENLRHLGRTGDHISKLRDSLLVFDRMVPFVMDNGEAWIPEKLHGRTRTLRRDIISLKDYDEHLSNKVQFLLDASLGLIGIEQSDIFKILTVVSVVGIPPTLVAGIYGMNFKNMPELNWAWGYEYGWAVIIISAVIPLIWCRLRGWI